MGSGRNALLVELGCEGGALEAALQDPAVVAAVRGAAAAAVVEAIPVVLAAQLARAVEDKGVAKDFLAAVGVLEAPSAKADDTAAVVSGFESALLVGLREALGLPELKG